MKPPGKGPSHVFPCHMFSLSLFTVCFLLCGTSPCVGWYWSGHGHLWVYYYILMSSVFLIVLFSYFSVRCTIFLKENFPTCINFIPYNTCVGPGSPHKILTKIKSNNCIKPHISYLLLNNNPSPQNVVAYNNHHSTYSRSCWLAVWPSLSLLVLLLLSPGLTPVVAVSGCLGRDGMIQDGLADVWQLSGCQSDDLVSLPWAFPAG